MRCEEYAGLSAREHLDAQGRTCADPFVSAHFVQPDRTSMPLYAQLLRIYGRDHPDPRPLGGGLDGLCPHLPLQSMGRLGLRPRAEGYPRRGFGPDALAVWPLALRIVRPCEEPAGRHGNPENLQRGAIWIASLRSQ